jgi:hypothetical protein
MAQVMIRGLISLRCSQSRCPACRDAGAEVFDHDVGFAHQVVEHGQSGLAFQVEGHALLVAVEGDVVGALPVEGVARIRGQKFAGPLALERLHLDRLGTQVGEDHRAVGSGQHVREIKNSHTTQWFCHTTIAPFG